eukprot:364298-Chlamydomonas_euryale.AAC.9
MREYAQRGTPKKPPCKAASALQVVPHAAGSTSHCKSCHASKPVSATHHMRLLSQTSTFGNCCCSPAAAGSRSPALWPAASCRLSLSCVVTQHFSRPSPRLYSPHHTLRASHSPPTILKTPPHTLPQPSGKRRLTVNGAPARAAGQRGPPSGQGRLGERRMGHAWLGDAGVQLQPARAARLQPSRQPGARPAAGPHGGRLAAARPGR